MTFNEATTQADDHVTLELASSGRRLAARALDIVIVGTVYLGIGTGLGLAGLADSVAADAVLAIVLYLLLPASYEVLCVAKLGRTLGKQLVGIQVCGDDGMPVRFSQSLVRFVIPLFGFGLAMIGGLLVWLSILFDSERSQGWHDKAASTIVVHKVDA